MFPIHTVAFKKILVLFAAASFILGSSPAINLAAAETLAQQTSKDFTTVAKKAIPAVVSIKVIGVTKQNVSMSGQELPEDFMGDDFFQRFFSVPKKKGGQSEPSIGQGSGFIISKDGLIITNSHVVHDTTEILVTLEDGRELPAKIIGQDPNTDVALIKIDATDLPYLQLGNSDKLEIGEWVVAIGNTLGLQATLTVGVVSAKGRNNLDLANVEDFIQTDASLNRGNSGGPLLNLNSEVIGMNTAIATSGSAGGYMGVGFAIPSNLIQHVVDQLKATGTVTRGFIGVTLQPVDHDIALAFGLKQSGGALIAEVSKDSPAEKSGLLHGDIIQTYNKQAVTNISALRNAIILMSPGSRINLGVLRNGKLLNIPVEIGIYPISAPQAASMSGNQLGFDVQDLTPDIAKTLGISDDRGIIIKKVDANSVAALAGLRKGALIVAVNQKPVSSVEQFNKALQETPAGRPVLLLVKQGDMTRYLSLRVGK